MIDSDILAGYGDWAANDGSIHIESVPAASPLSQWTDQVTVTTEQITVFRPLTDGRVVVPQVDPQGSGVGYAERASNGVWADRPQRIAIDGEHVLDMVEFGGRLWACGSDGDATHDYAVVWHSTDGGATWVESLRDPLSVVNSRFFCLAPIGDTLWVRNGEQGHTFKWTVADGWSSSATAVLLPGVYGGPGKPWDSGYVIPSLMPGQGPCVLYFFDGTTTSEIATDVRGWDIGDDGTLCLLGPDGVVQRYASAAASPVAGVQVAYPSTYCSLAVIPGSSRAIVGRADSRIAVVPLP